jgi:phage tail-like protein
MRGTIEDLATPHPLIEGLPAVFREPELFLAVRPDAELLLEPFLAGLDLVLAPILATLDCLEAYLDPRLTPPDFLPWLAGWVGLEPDERWTDQQLRELMAVTIGLYRRRGTVAGIKALVKAYTGIEPDVDDSGGSVVVPRREPGRPVGAFDYPGTAEPWVRVRVKPSNGESISEARLRELLTTALPAHVRVVIEVEQLQDRG